MNSYLFLIFFIPKLTVDYSIQVIRPTDKQRREFSIAIKLPQDIWLLPGSLPSSGHCSGPDTSTLPYFIGIFGPPAS